jgi:uncharacterized repeat protein (TIGR01451 family)
MVQHHDIKENSSMKQFGIWTRTLMVLFFLAFSSIAWAAKLNVLSVNMGGIGADFGRVEEFVEVSPVVAGTNSKCNFIAPCSFTVPNGTTITVKLTITPSAQEFLGWVEAFPGTDLNKVCIGGKQLICTFDTGQDTVYYAQANTTTLAETLEVTYDQGQAFRKPVSAEVDVQYLGWNDPTVFTVRVLSEGRQFSFLAGPWQILAVRAADTECSLVSGQVSPNFSVQPTGITPLVVRFKPDRCGLTAKVNNATGGQISSSSAGITDCTDSCGALFQFGSSVSLTATPKAGFVFDHWSSGETTPSIVVAITAVAQTRTAFFVQRTATTADLEVTQSALNPTVTPGSSVNFTIRVKNLGPDPTSNVVLEYVLPAGYSGLGFVPSQGSCNTAMCYLGDLTNGAIATVDMTATPALGAGSFVVPASVSSDIFDPLTTNNTATLIVSIVGNVPPVTVSFGSSNPGAKTVLKGSSKVAALQVLVTPPVGSSVTDYALAGLTLQASGTGNDASDITAVKLFPDNNGNGLIDAGEDTLQFSSGVFTTDDGTLNLSFAPTGILAGRNYLIALDFSSVIAMNQFGISLGSVLMLAGIGFSRRRKFGLGLLALGLMVTLVSCPGGSTTPETRTYKLTLTAINIQKAGSSAAVSGLPLSGAVLSVEK